MIWTERVRKITFSRLDLESFAAHIQVWRKQLSVEMDQTHFEIVYFNFLDRKIR